MTETHDALQKLLGPTGRDTGCDRGLELLDRFVDAEQAGQPAREIFPELATHLEACPDCHEDYVGLLDLASGTERRPAGS